MATTQSLSAHPGDSPQILSSLSASVTGLGSCVLKSHLQSLHSPHTPGISNPHHHHPALLPKPACCLLVPVSPTPVSCSRGGAPQGRSCLPALCPCSQSVLPYIHKSLFMLFCSTRDHTTRNHAILRLPFWALQMLVKHSTTLLLES